MEKQTREERRPQPHDPTWPAAFRNRAGGETDAAAEVRVPTAYQVYDTAHLRGTWEDGLDLLIQDAEAGRRRFDRQVVAEALELPEDWGWEAIRSRLQQSGEPEQAFNRLLGVLYRSDRSIDFAPIPTRVTPTEVRPLPGEEKQNQD